MDMGWVALAISSLVGLIGVFFGAQFWGMQKSLIQGQQKHIVQKNATIDELQGETRALRDRIDQLEIRYYKLVNDLNNCQNLADNYIAMIDGLKVEIAKMNSEHL